MARKGISRVDATEYERSSLDNILKKDKRVSDDTRYVSVEDALREKAVYKVDSERDITRVLFISEDESLLNPEQQSLDGYTNISDMFDEVHILILRQGIKSKNPVLRVAENVWLYIASDKNWWWTPIKGKKMADKQLSFAGGFRPDIIVARDPFESAVLALMLGKKYDRPVQIHVLEDFTKLDFLRKSKHNRWRRRLPQYLLPKVSSVRVGTKALRDLISHNFKIKDLSILPRLNNYEALIDTPKTLDLKEKYKPFKFIILYAGHLTFESKFYKAIDAARYGLRDPGIGMVVLGSGPAHKEFVKRAEVLGVKEQVVFDTVTTNIVPHLKSADVLVIPDTDGASEELALQGAAAGIPMILARTPAREDLFVNNESALLCDADDIDQISLKLNDIMKGDELRESLVKNAQKMIRRKFHEDPAEYMRDFRQSIERVLFVEEEDLVEEKSEETITEEIGESDKDDNERGDETTEKDEVEVNEEVKETNKN